MGPCSATDKQVVVNGSVDSIEDNILDLDQILHQDMIGKAPLQSSIREYQHCRWCTIAIVFCFDAHVFSLFLYDFLFLFTLLLFSCYMQKHLFVVRKRIDERGIKEGNCTIEVFVWFVKNIWVFGRDFFIWFFWVDLSQLGSTHLTSDPIIKPGRPPGWISKLCKKGLIMKKKRV